MAISVNIQGTKGKQRYPLDMTPFGIIFNETIRYHEEGEMIHQPQSAFRALSDPTRRDILRLLATQDMTIAEVTDRFDITRPAIKKHLTILQEGNLIHVQAKGRERINSLNPAGMAPVLDWLEYFNTFWDDRLSALKTVIEKDNT
jgi:DNA-binding transcriptional ArsR family regulator